MTVHEMLPMSILVSIIFENIFYSFFLSTSLCYNRELCNFKKLVCPSNVILEKSMIVEVAVSICLLTFLHLENLSEKRCFQVVTLEKLTTTSVGVNSLSMDPHVIFKSNYVYF